MLRSMIAASIICAFLSPSTADAKGRHHHRYHYAQRHHHHHHAVRTAHRGLGNIGGLQSSFRSALTPLLNATGCSVGSGYRSHAAQAALYRAKPGLAARPGHSNHERGLAADLSCGGGGLAKMHRLASAAGLRFPMSYEPWHIEPQGATRYASRSRYASLYHHRHAYLYVRHHHHRRYARV